MAKVYLEGILWPGGVESCLFHSRGHILVWDTTSRGIQFVILVRTADNIRDRLMWLIWLGGLELYYGLGQFNPGYSIDLEID